MSQLRHSLVAGFGCLVFGLGCAGGFSGSASASASVNVKPGYFFGHDLRSEERIVYVLDLSGSMSESSGSVVEQAGTDAAGKAVGGITGSLFGSRAGSYAKRRIKKLKKKIEKVKLHTVASLNGLSRNARFNLIMFSDGVQKLSPGMIKASGLSVGAVSLFVDQLEEGGGTNMYAAVEAALYMDATHIIVLTDGMPTSSTPDDILDLVAEHNSDDEIKISTVGVGGDQAREFLSALAEENGGAYTMYD